MTDNDLKKCAARLIARRQYTAARAMTLRDRLSAAWLACLDWRYAFEGALRGWRC